MALTQAHDQSAQANPTALVTWNGANGFNAEEEGRQTQVAPMADGENGQQHREVVPAGDDASLGAEIAICHWTLNWPLNAQKTCLVM
jgi:hypothetical protein